MEEENIPPTTEISTAPPDAPDTAEIPEPESEEPSEPEYRYKEPEPAPVPNRAIRRLLAKQVRHARTRAERLGDRLMGLLVCTRCGLPSVAVTQNRCQCKAKTNQQIRREEFIRQLGEQLQQGKISINDARSLLGMPPVEMVPDVSGNGGSEK